MTPLDFEILLGPYVWPAKAIGLNTCNSYNTISINNDSSIEDEEIIRLSFGVAAGPTLRPPVSVTLTPTHGLNMSPPPTHIRFPPSVSTFAVAAAGTVSYLPTDGKSCHSTAPISAIAGTTPGVSPTRSSGQPASLCSSRLQPKLQSTTRPRLVCFGHMQ